MRWGLGTYLYLSTDGVRATFAGVSTGSGVVCCSCRLAEGGVSSTRSTLLLPTPLSDAEDSPFDCLSADFFPSGSEKQLFSTCFAKRVSRWRGGGGDVGGVGVVVRWRDGQGQRAKRPNETEFAARRSSSTSIYSHIQHAAVPKYTDRQRSGIYRHCSRIVSIDTGVRRAPLSALPGHVR